MTVFAKFQTVLIVAFLAALTAVTAMTYHRAGAHGFFVPWAWFGWFHAYGAHHPWTYAGDIALGGAVFFVPVALTLLLLNLARVPGRVKAFGAGAWATTADLLNARIVLTKDDISGRIIGKWRGKFMVFKGDEPALIIGGTRSGKGAGHVVPTLLSWTGSALVYDRKGELWQIAVDRRKTFSHCILFAPTDIHTARWNPLFEVRWGRMEIADVQNVVIVLVDPTGSKRGDLDFWEKSAGAFYVAIILHVLYTAPDAHKNLAEVRRRMGDMPELLHEMLNTVHRHRPDYYAEDGFARDANGQKIPEAHPEVVRGAKVYARMEPKVQSSVTSTMETALDLWADPNVAYATSWSDFMIGDLMCADHPVSLFITTPQAHAERLAFLVRVFMRSTVNSLMESETLDSRGRRKRHRLLLMIDEFPKIGRLPFIESMLGEMTSYGFTAHFVCQTFADIYQAYTRDTSLFGNFKITAVCNAADTSGFKEVIERAGKTRELRQAFSDPRGLVTKGHRSVSQTEQVQDILTSDQVRGLPEDEQFLFITGAKPIRSKKVRYFKERLLKAHASQYFHDKPDVNLADYQQRRGQLDLPKQTKIDWVGVKPLAAAPPYVPPGVEGDRARSSAQKGGPPSGETASAGAPSGVDVAYLDGLKNLSRDD